MPPSMQKSDVTSVRERVLAIERGQLSENSIIRARYVPDVRGVNRYKHFHVPNPSVRQNEHEKTSTSPKEATDLPHLRSTRFSRGRTSRHHVNDSSDDNGVEKGRRAKKTVLPQLGSASTVTKIQKERDICDYIEQQAKAALASSDSLSSSTTTRSTFSGRKLQDHLSNAHQQLTPRTFASLARSDPESGSNEEAATSSKIQTSSRATSPARTEAITKKDAEAQLSARSLKETATQTVIHAKELVIQATPSELAEEGRSMHTESMAIEVTPAEYRKNEVRAASREDYGEQEALYQVIEDALGETIDRYSRLRTNQIIANSARKQGQIWRDAKDFIANQLVPQSIQLANKSRSRNKTAVEIVASIKCYP